MKHHYAFPLGQALLGARTVSFPGTAMPGTQSALGTATLKKKPQLKPSRIRRWTGGYWSCRSHKEQRLFSLRPALAGFSLICRILKVDLVGGTTERRGDTQSRERMTVIKLFIKIPLMLCMIFINCLKGKNVFLKLHPRDSTLLNPCTAVSPPWSGGSLGVVGNLWEGGNEQVDWLIESTLRAFLHPQASLDAKEGASSASRAVASCPASSSCPVLMALWLPPGWRGLEHGALGQVKVRLEEETGGVDITLVLHMGV